MTFDINPVCQRNNATRMGETNRTSFLRGNCTSHYIWPFILQERVSNLSLYYSLYWVLINWSLGSPSRELNSSYIHDETTCKNISHVDKRWHWNFPIERCFDWFGNDSLTTTLKKLLYFTLTFKENDQYSQNTMHSFTFHPGKTSGTVSWSWETTSYRYAPYFLSELWVLWDTTATGNCGYFETRLPSGIVGIMRHNFHRELWVFWGTTTVDNCGYYEAQIPSKIVGSLRHNYMYQSIIWIQTFCDIFKGLLYYQM